MHSYVVIESRSIYRNTHYGMGGLVVHCLIGIIDYLLLAIDFGVIYVDVVFSF